MSKDSRSTPALWEKVAHNLQEMYAEAVGWTEEKARIGVKRMDILSVQRHIRRLMGELGGRVYDVAQRGVSVESDASVQGLIDEIRRLERELEVREREIDALKEGRGGRTAAREEGSRAPEAPAAETEPPDGRRSP